MIIGTEVVAGILVAVACATRCIAIKIVESTGYGLRARHRHASSTVRMAPNLLLILIKELLALLGRRLIHDDLLLLPDAILRSRRLELAR